MASGTGRRTRQPCPEKRRYRLHVKKKKLVRRESHHRDLWAKFTFFSRAQKTVRPFARARRVKKQSSRRSTHPKARRDKQKETRDGGGEIQRSNAYRVETYLIEIFSWSCVRGLFFCRARGGQDVCTFTSCCFGIGEMNFFSKGNARDGEELRERLLEAHGHTNQSRSPPIGKKILRQEKITRT